MACSRPPGCSIFRPLSDRVPLYAEDPAMVEDPRLLTLNTPWDQMVLRAKLALAQGREPAVPEGAHLPPRPGDPATTLDGLRKEMETLGAIVRAWRHHAGGDRFPAG